MIKTKNILIPYFFAILISLFVSLPFFHSYLAERAKLAVMKEELNREDIHVREIIKAENEIMPYVNILNEIKKGMPSDPALPSTIYYLERVAVDSGLQLSNIGSFSTSDSPDRLNLKETTIEMGVVGGSYSSLKGFIKELERSVKLFDIVSASISPSSGADDTGETEASSGARFLLSLKLKTYSY